jgi:thiamine biosynthesis lipoprotein
MGTTAHVIVVGSVDLAGYARRRIDELEQRWSRFVPTSEVSIMNARRGRPVRVSTDTFRLVAASIDGWARSDGRFDPTVLGDMLRAGYDETFAVVAIRGGGGVSLLVRNAGGIRLDADRSEVTLPDDAGFDPGGIGKGLAADIVVDEVMALGALGACVNIGGDLRVEGLAPDGERRWVVALGEPGDEVAPNIGLEGGGVATSTITKRAWFDGDVTRHHVIDPATGRSSRGVVTVTAISRTAASAEVSATSSMLASPDQAVAALEHLGADGVVRLASGELAATAGFRRFQLETAAEGSVDFR